MPTTGSFSTSGSGFGFGVQFNLIDGFTSVAQKIKSGMSSLSSSATSAAGKIKNGFSSIFSNLGNSANGFFNRFSRGINAVSNRMQDSFYQLRNGLIMITAGVAMLAPWNRMVEESSKREAAENALITFTGSARAAHQEFQQIIADSNKSPIDITTLSKLQMAMQSMGKTAQESRGFALDLMNAVYATDVTGNAQNTLTRLIPNVQQFAAGVTGEMDVKQFGYAGIQIRDLIGKYLPEVDIKNLKGTQITFDMIAKALHSASQEGGVFFGAIDRYMQTTGGGVEMFKKQWVNAMASVGDAIKPAYNVIVGFLTKLLTKFIEFSQTDTGKLVIRMAALITLFLSLTSIVAGLVLILPKAVKVVKEMSIALGLMNKYTAFRSTATFMERWGKFLGVIAAVAAIIGVLTSAWKAFDDVMNGGKVQADGWLGFLQRLGGYMKAAVEIFKSVDKDGWSLPKPLYDVLNGMGIMDGVTTLGQFISRLYNMWLGFKQGLKDAWEVLKAVVSWIGKHLWKPVGEFFSNFFGFNKKFTDSVEDWRQVGYVIGVVLVGALTLFGISLLVDGVMALASFSTAIAGVIGELILLATGVALSTIEIWAFVFLAWELWRVIDFVIDKIMEWATAFGDWLRPAIAKAWDDLTAFAGAQVAIGEMWVDNLLIGIKNKWGMFTNVLKDMIRNLPFIGSMLDEAGFLEPSKAENMVSMDGGAGAAGLAGVMADNRARRYAQPPQDNTPYNGKAPDLINNIYLDGDLIHSSIKERDRVDKSRD